LEIHESKKGACVVQTIIIAVIGLVLGGGGLVGIIKLIIDPRREKKKEREAAKNAEQTKRKELGRRVFELIRLYRTDLQNIGGTYNEPLARFSLPFNRSFVTTNANKLSERQKEMAALASELALNPDAADIYNAIIAWIQAVDAYGTAVTQHKTPLHKADPQTLSQLDHEINEKVEALEAAVRAYISAVK